MQQLPDATLSTNFTARVLAEASRPQPADRNATGLGRKWWLAWAPRVAVAALVLCSCLFGYHQHQRAQRDRIARDLATLSGVAVVSDPKILQDFETIRRLSQTPSADEELLALLK